MLKPTTKIHYNACYLPAAFRRLCVETSVAHHRFLGKYPAAFRRLCVETNRVQLDVLSPSQPPSGGCVLKQHKIYITKNITPPAAFRRLCVETARAPSLRTMVSQPPSGGCVLKHFGNCRNVQQATPAAFRRLCVETFWKLQKRATGNPSRLQAAVC